LRSASGPAVRLLKVGGVDVPEVTFTEEDRVQQDAETTAVVSDDIDGNNDPNLPLADDPPLDLDEITRLH
jgi:hypothetical protein